jgi:hypothetical protein
MNNIQDIKCNYNRQRSNIETLRISGLHENISRNDFQTFNSTFLNIKKLKQFKFILKLYLIMG